MSDLLITPFINRDTGKLVYLRHGRAYFEAGHVFGLNPLRFSPKAKPLGEKPQLATNVIGLLRQPIFDEQGSYLGRLGGWQFAEPDLLLASIIVVDASLWRKIAGRTNPDLVVSRSQIRELQSKKIVITIAGQLIKESQVPCLIAQ